jgi:ubiquinone/menaquinone biosynthesis C-methylase UbiE
MLFRGLVPDGGGDGRDEVGLLVPAGHAVPGEVDSVQANVGVKVIAVGVEVEERPRPVLEIAALPLPQRLDFAQLGQEVAESVQVRLGGVAHATPYGAAVTVGWAGMGESGGRRGFAGMAADYVGPSPQAARLVALARLRPGERVLDAGCGPGTATSSAAERVGRGGAVVAVDIAEDMLALARAAVAPHPQVAVLAMDVTALGFRDSTFDAVVASSVLQFSGPGSLGEWARVTRPGGRVACSLPWGPDVWTELCRRHVDEATEPYRSDARRRLAAAAVRPDAERVRQRLGLAAVATEVEPIVQRFASPAEAWASLYRHGARLFLEALPASALRAFHDEFCAWVATSDGAELRSEFLYWCFTTPG